MCVDILKGREVGQAEWLLRYEDRVIPCLDIRLKALTLYTTRR
jgi:hypothetical protein